MIIVCTTLNSPQIKNRGELYLWKILRFAKLLIIVNSTVLNSGNDVIKACKTDSEGKVVEGRHTVYRMSASTEEEKDDWIKCIQ